MRKAFSLVELSIVLVILGLLTGGILAGQSLIRASELRSITNDLTKYVTTAHSFRDKYFQLPGDISNATKFWGEADADGPTCKTTSSSGVLTCNGDGDGRIEYGTSTSNEGFRYWQHLASAGMIEGTYIGIEGSSGNVVHSIPGTNVPRGRITTSGPSWYYYSSEPSNSYTGTVGNVMFYGITQGTSVTNGVFIKAEEQWNIDTKMDDGKPAYGRIRSYDATARSNCSSSNTASAADYTLTSTAIGCTIIFLPGF